jgi:hypothetical protein
MRITFSTFDEVFDALDFQEFHNAVLENVKHYEKKDNQHSDVNKRITRGYRNPFNFILKTYFKLVGLDLKTHKI